jgi:hypothetical protein
MASRFRDLLRRLRGAAAPTAPRLPPTPPAPPGSAASRDRQAEASTPLPENDLDLLSTHLRRIGHLDARPTQAEPSLRAALLRLWQSGGQSEAVRLGAALAAAIPGDLDLQLQVAELLWQKRDAEGALVPLSRVFGHPGIAALSAPDPTRARPPAPGSDVDALHGWLLRARLLRGEIRHAQGEYVEARADLADILISEWPALGQGPSASALARFRAASPTRPEGPALRELVGAAHLGSPGAAATLLGPGAASRYRLLRELGVGESGVVYVALDTQLGCELALKRFHDALHRPPPGALDGALGPTVSPVPGALTEAQLICALHHPGVLALYDQDVDGRYLTMELCEAGSLRARLRGARLPLAVTLHRLGELCDGLAAVHAVAIEHGDIKPENLLFRSPARSLRPPAIDPEYGDLVISDFGIAQSLAAARTGLSTGAGPIDDPQRLRGTRGYLPPERLHGRAPSVAGLGRGDLYSVGIVLFELLLGRLPQGPLGEAAPDAEIDAAVATAPAHLLPDLRSLLRRLLAADPAARPTAREAHGEFARLLPRAGREASS